MKRSKKDPRSSTAWHGDLPVTSRYTFGVAGERFYRTIKDEGKLVGTYCPKCDRTYVPAALFCERCMSELDAWKDIGDTGIVHTFTLLYEDLDGERMDDPEIIAFIRLGDGGLVHRLKGIDREDLSIGMRVKAVYKKENQRIGSIEDISHFQAVI